MVEENSTVQSAGLKPAEEHKAVSTEVSITERAAAKLREFIEKEGKDPALTGLRLGVKGGGCSGFSYDIKLGEQQEKDKVFEQHGVKLFVDMTSYMYLMGSIVEYKESLLQSGFEIRNPNVTSTCGCGESISF